MSRVAIKIPPSLEQDPNPSPTEVLSWALDTFKPWVLMTTAFGLNGVALIHLAHSVDPSLPILFIDTGFHFPETLETKKRLVERYGLNLIERRVPAFVKNEKLADQNLSFLESPELCCAERKVKVFQKALEELRPNALISARSRYQSETRSSLSVIELDTHPVQINPLAHWSLEEVEGFVRENQIPYNPLHDRGYQSIGCWPCTQPVAPGEDVRSGRWSGDIKKECGIWIEGGKVVRSGQ
jgi:phosphoadenosine phosphosulfate reductase